MNLRDLQNKKIALLGLGVENYALLKFLLKRKVRAHFIICDLRSAAALGDKFQELNRFDNVVWQLGEDFKQNLGRYDILFRSPGWPLFCSGVTQAQKLNKKIVVTSPMKLFFDICPTKNIIGVTGTKGKGTTASLIYDILRENFKTHPALRAPLSKRGITSKVWLGGNIGVAPFAFIDKISQSGWVVLELSSFQLENLKTSPKIAVLTNFTREHLAPADPNNPNYHKSLKEYREAKFNIARFQKKGDFFVVNDKLSRVITAQAGIQSQKRKTLDSRLRGNDSRAIFFTKSDLPSKLVGEHNKENIAAAEAVAKIVGIQKDTVARAVKNFKGLEHRIELVKEVKGVKYYDDSFATTPESAIIALKSFPLDSARGKSIILLAGGADKGADFKNFAKEIAKRVKFACLLKGKATPRLKQAIIKAGFDKKQIKEFSDINRAVQTAAREAKAGDIVLLSTACASFGMFANYKQRGDLFKQAVRQLKK